MFTCSVSRMSASIYLPLDQMIQFRPCLPCRRPKVLDFAKLARKANFLGYPSVNIPKVAAAACGGCRGGMCDQWEDFDRDPMLYIEPMSSLMCPAQPLELSLNASKLRQSLDRTY